MESKVLNIPLSYIDSVTKTVVQVSGTVWHLRVEKGIDNQLVGSDR